MRNTPHPLNIAWREDWPQGWPHFFWGQWLISPLVKASKPLDSASDSTVELGSDSLHQAIKSCYPQLSFAQLAHLYEQWRHNPALQQELNWQALMAGYGFRDSEPQRLTLQKLIQMPSPFQAWAHHKALGPKDLAILLSFAEPNPDFDELLEWMAHSQTSKSIGVQVLEIAGELLLMGKALPSRKSLRPESYLMELEGQRRPLSRAALENKNQELSTLPWPARCSGRWLRLGDALVLETKVMGSNFQEVRQRLEALSRVFLAREDSPSQPASELSSPSEGSCQ